MSCDEAFLGGYTPPDMALWDGRVDASGPRAALRWHQVVAPLDLGRDEAPSADGARGFALVGYRCDDGIARNLGRPGAIAGPTSIRRRMGNLPVGFSDQIALLDAGDITFVDGPVERAQSALAAAVARILELGLFPIVLGGGHDLTYGHFLGASSDVPPEQRLGVVSFDAHFDLRPADQGANSGTSFWQIARECERTGRPFDTLCIGIQRSANTVALFTRARELGVETVLARDIAEHRLDEVRQVIDGFAARTGRLLVTLDVDVMSSAFCPGVSSAQPLGLDPEIVVRLLKHVLARGHVMSFDVAEVSPRFDLDDNTAKVAAIMIYAVVDMLIPDGERILEG
jgi:formiminoglutamase